MTATKEESGFSKKQILAICIIALVQFTVVLDFMIISPLGDILMKSMHIQPQQFGTAVSAYAFSAGISGFLSASYADRFDRKRLLIIFYIGFLIGTFFCGFANSYPALVAARIITGIFGGVIGSIGMAIITDLFTLNQRGRAMSFVQMAFAGSQILGIPLGLKLADMFNWHASFYMIVLLGMVIFLGILFFLQPINAHLSLQKHQTAIEHLFGTIKKRDYRIGFLAIGFLSIGGYMIMPFTSAFLINNVGLSNSQLILVFMLTGVASMVIMPVIGKLSDSFNKYTVFLYGSVLASVMVLIYTNLSQTPFYAVVIINMILFAGILGRAVPAVALNSALPEASDRGAYMSITSSLQQLAGGIGAFIAGHVVVQSSSTSPLQHFDTLGYLMILIFAICVGLIFRVHRIIAARTTIN